MICPEPGCGKEVVRTAGRGRPRRFCSREHANRFNGRLGRLRLQLADAEDELRGAGAERRGAVVGGVRWMDWSQRVARLEALVARFTEELGATDGFGRT